MTIERDELEVATVDGIRLEHWREVRCVLCDGRPIYNWFLKVGDGEPFGWGHGLADAVDSMRCERLPYGSGQSWRVGLARRNHFKAHLPCCGGRFVLDKDHGGYVACCSGHCSDCWRRWEDNDGCGVLTLLPA